MKSFRPSTSRSKTSARVLTDTDVFRLERVAATARDQEAAALLRAAIARAEVERTSRVAADVVTMNSRVVVEDGLTRLRRVVTLVYPDHATPRAGLVSILSPLGLALLGRRIGDVVETRSPSGRDVRLTLVGLEYQPEAAGDLHL